MCRTLERRVFVLVSLAVAEVVGEMDLEVTTANPIFLEANALALPEIHGQTREGGGGAKTSGRRGGSTPKGLHAGPSRSHHCSQTPAR